jgi:hypothetical protein
MKAIKIPADGSPVTFDALRELNADAQPDELVQAFEHLPPELRQQAWADYALRVALDAWNADSGAGEAE